jgi:SAM-dependent methyltransferase
MFKRRRQIDYFHSAKIIRQDFYISSIYIEIYKKFSNLIATKKIINPKVLELGGGNFSFGRMYWQDLIVTDAEQNGYSEFVQPGVKAESLPYADNSFNFVIAKDALHHFKEPWVALQEIYRVLKPGGAFVVSEPYWSLLGRFIYKYFHPEPWEVKVISISRDSNDLWDSNQALLLLLTKNFSKDLKDKMPNFDLKIFEPTYGASYLLSGGVHTRNKISGKFLWQIHKIERKIKLLMKITGFNIIAQFEKAN